MLGTLVNVGAIIAGSLAGLLFNKKISEKYHQTIMQAISLGVILIGLKGAFPSEDFIMIVVSLALGSLVGEFCEIEKRLETMGKQLETRFSKEDDSTFATGFVTTSLIYCVGAMAIVGSLESGLAGKHDTLFAKATIDGIAAIIFASSMGLGVLFSSVSVLLYQGTITLAAAYIKPFLVPEVISQMSAVGGLLIVAIGLKMLLNVKIKIGNMLPSVFFPLLFYIFSRIFN